MCSLAVTTAARNASPSKKRGERRRRQPRHRCRGVTGSRGAPPGGKRPVERRLRRGGRDLALDLVGHQHHPLAGVVEDHQVVEAGQHGERQPVRIGRSPRQALEQADRVVAEEADEAAGERQGPRVAGDPVDDPAQRGERLAGDLPALEVAVAFQPVGVEPVELARPGAEEAEARHLFAAGDALEEEAHRREPGEPPVDGERGQRVGEQLPQVRDRPPRRAALIARRSSRFRGAW